MLQVKAYFGKFRGCQNYGIAFIDYLVLGGTAPLGNIPSYKSVYPDPVR